MAAIVSIPGGFKGGAPAPYAPVGGGNPAGRAMGHYGKAPPAIGSPAASVMAPKMPSPSTSLPTTPKTDLSAVRGGAGGMRAHIRMGGLMPGKAIPGPGNI
jgi:hypothetical protein